MKKKTPKRIKSAAELTARIMELEDELLKMVDPKHYKLAYKKPAVRKQEREFLYEVKVEFNLIVSAKDVPTAERLAEECAKIQSVPFDYTHAFPIDHPNQVRNELLDRIPYGSDRKDRRTILQRLAGVPKPRPRVL